MTKRGRPRLTADQQPVVIHIELRLYPGIDDDLIAFYSSIATNYRASATRAALRSGNITTVDIGDLPSDEEMAAKLEALLF